MLTQKTSITLNLTETSYLAIKHYSYDGMPSRGTWTSWRGGPVWTSWGSTRPSARSYTWVRV